MAHVKSIAGKHFYTIDLSAAQVLLILAAFELSKTGDARRLGKPARDLECKLEEGLQAIAPDIFEAWAAQTISERDE